MRPSQQGAKLSVPWHFAHSAKHVPVGDCEVVLGSLVVDAGFVVVVVVVSVLADSVVDVICCSHVQGPPAMQGQTPAGRTAHAAAQAASVAPSFSAPSALLQVMIPSVVDMLVALVVDGIGVVEMDFGVVVWVVCTWEAVTVAVVVVVVVVCTFVVAAGVVCTTGVVVVCDAVGCLVPGPLPQVEPPSFIKLIRGYSLPPLYLPSKSSKSNAQTIDPAKPCSFAKASLAQIDCSLSYPIHSPS